MDACSHNHKHVGAVKHIPVHDTFFIVVSMCDSLSTFVSIIVSVSVAVCFAHPSAHIHGNPQIFTPHRSCVDCACHSLSMLFFILLGFAKCFSHNVNPPMDALLRRSHQLVWAPWEVPSKSEVLMKYCLVVDASRSRIRLPLASWRVSPGCSYYDR